MRYRTAVIALGAIALVVGCSRKPAETVWEKLDGYPDLGITFSVQNNDNSAKVVSIKTNPPIQKLVYNGGRYEEHLVQLQYNCTTAPVEFTALRSIYSGSSGVTEEPVPPGRILVVPDTPWEAVSRRVCS